jgi:hypothetical protein
VVLVVGLIVLVSGFSYGLFSAIRNDAKEELGEETVVYAREVVAAYGSEEGTIILASFLADRDLSGIGDAVSGNPARVTIALSDGRTFTQYYPSRSEFESGGIQVTESVYIGVDLGNGSNLPGVLEVTVNGT